jgi:hypothetical protein
VQWAWNVNPYMPIDNEAVIGLFRPDGTAKPEFDVLRRFAAFAKRIAPRLSDDEVKDAVVLILPCSRTWGGRPGGFDGAKRIVRVLADRFGVAPICVPDVVVPIAFGEGVALSVAPTNELEHFFPRHLNIEVLQEAPTEYTPNDPRRKHLQIGPDFAGLPTTPLALHQEVDGNGAKGGATFDQNGGERLRIGASARIRPSKDVPFWHEPLPLDFAREEEPLRALLGEALKHAGVPTSPSDVPATATVRLMKDGALVTVVNESAADLVRRVMVEGKPLDVAVARGRARCLLVDRTNLSVLADSNDAP